MGAISVLPELVRNRIAAGEVVERPASVVKELVENSLDAGASRVEVEIESGGRRRIKVSDDGSGMSAEDLALSVERFATSKLRSEGDLSVVSTLGFRGEALPSIASVAELTITTRRPDDGAGFALSSDPGRAPGAPRPAASPPGTTVEARNLFARTPARLRFLRSDDAETKAAAEVVERLALSRRDVAFRLRADGRELLAAPACPTLRERVAEVLGEATARALVEARFGEPGWLAAEGLVTAPGGPTRADRRWGFLFLNGRPIRDNALSHAVRSAFASALPPGRQPVFILLLDVAPGEVDVNVHPAKHEVRFRHPQAVYSFLLRGLREALSSPDGRAGVGPLPMPVARRGAMGDGAPWDAGVFPSHAGPLAREAGAAFTVGVDAAAGPLAVPLQPETPGDAGARVLGALRPGYVLVETARDLRIVDPHALHERIIYERLSRPGGGEPPSQSLLVPEPVELSPAEAAEFAASRDALAGLGFVADRFGERAALVRAVPEGVPPASAGEVLREVMADLAAGFAPAVEPVERLRRSLACRAAVKLGGRLSGGEVEALLREGEGVPAACPHGRPVAWVIDFAEITRRLGR